jgi:DNA-binding NarL/FixJ family response regulator
MYLMRIHVKDVNLGLGAPRTQERKAGGPGWPSAGKRPRVATMVGVHHIRLVVVDDSIPFLRSFCSFLQHYPQIELVAAESDPGKALQELEQLRPDLVVMDFQMPEMHGLEALARIRSQNRDLKVIMLTAHDTPELRQASLAAGSDAFISKSRLVQELPPVLAKILEALEDEEDS